ncbi:hypothetical protein HOT31_gp126 [Microbacterium phage Hendrix]|uniref:Uncharacterized protein n=1 Tax=Microbacterium phage Hendrix TaxID=2182341 RepID=A0A2U8UUW7_9CAUD|nr:hypothetical protein HOT31_gp126 [Microbacterium phage Hendrix]AWN07796.1 hypothetical protein PBI_HENDRIX_125 [Microbacterium phage Hendrix]
MSFETTVEVRGTKYFAELVRITRTHIGYEDHGIFSMNIDFEGLSGGWGQGLGHRFMTDPIVFHTWIQLIVDHFGPWQDLKGKELYALYEKKNQEIVGLASKSDQSRIFTLGDVDMLIAKAREEYLASVVSE